MAIMLVEHAVLTCMLGPLRSKYQLNLLAKNEAVVPVAVLTGAVSASLDTIFIKSVPMEAANTDVSVPATFSAGMPARDSVSTGSISAFRHDGTHHFRMLDMMLPIAIAVEGP